MDIINSLLPYVENGTFQDGTTKLSGDTDSILQTYFTKHQENDFLKLLDELNYWRWVKEQMMAVVTQENIIIQDCFHFNRFLKKGQRFNNKQHHLYPELLQTQVSLSTIQELIYRLQKHLFLTLQSQQPFDVAIQSPLFINYHFKNKAIEASTLKRANESLISLIVESKETVSENLLITLMGKFQSEPLFKRLTQPYNMKTEVSHQVLQKKELNKEQLHVLLQGAHEPEALHRVLQPRATTEEVKIKLHQQESLSTELVQNTLHSNQVKKSSLVETINNPIDVAQEVLMDAVKGGCDEEILVKVVSHEKETTNIKSVVIETIQATSYKELKAVDEDLIRLPVESKETISTIEQEENCTLIETLTQQDKQNDEVLEQLLKKEELSEEQVLLVLQSAHEPQSLNRVLQHSAITKEIIIRLHQHKTISKEIILHLLTTTNTEEVLMDLVRGRCDETILVNLVCHEKATTKVMSAVIAQDSFTPEIARLLDEKIPDDRLQLASVKALQRKNYNNLDYFETIAKRTNSTEVLTELLNTKTLSNTLISTVLKNKHMDGRIIENANEGAIKLLVESKETLSEPVLLALVEKCQHYALIEKLLQRDDLNEEVLRLVLKKEPLSENQLLLILEKAKSHELIELVFSRHKEITYKIQQSVYQHRLLTSEFASFLLANYTLKTKSLALLLKHPTAITEEVLMGVVRQKCDAEVLALVLSHDKATPKVKTLFHS